MLKIEISHMDLLFMLCHCGYVGANCSYFCNSEVLCTHYKYISFMHVAFA